jgi:hypothetical protein
LGNQSLMGELPLDAKVARADLDARPVELDDSPFAEAVCRIVAALEEQLGAQRSPR